MSLAADGEDGNELQLNWKIEAKLSKLFPRVFKKSILMAVVCFLFANEGFIFL